MIKYQLACASAHEFEAWFGSGMAFDEQRRAKQVLCPVCGSHTIEKRPMAPAIVTSRMKSRQPSHQSPAEIPPATPTASGAPMQAVSATAPDIKAAIDAMRHLKSDVIANTENVGERFAEEARRIHFGESPERAIRGAATMEEARELHEDGVDFGILPQLPDEQN